MRQLLADIDDAVKEVLRTYRRLLTISSTSGDEGGLGDRLEEHLRNSLRESERQGHVLRVQDMLVARVGNPNIALIGKLDTVGFMAGYDRQLLPIGEPRPRGGERIFGLAPGGECEVPIRPLPPRNSSAEAQEPWRYDGPLLPPGTRLSYRHKPFVKSGRLHGPYLDGRLTLALLLALFDRLPNVAIALVADTQHSGSGMPIMGRTLVEELGFKRALRCDVLPVESGLILGRGPGIALMGPPLPRTSFVETISSLIGKTAVPHQLALSGQGVTAPLDVPLDTLTIGLPIANRHSHEEAIAMSDLKGLCGVYVSLISELDRG